jgi:hypothetical protein
MQQLLYLLPVLACPLMMLICMGGLFGRKKDCHKSGNGTELAEKVDLLVKQNMELQKELHDLKNQKNAG